MQTERIGIVLYIHIEKYLQNANYSKGTPSLFILLDCCSDRRGLKEKSKKKCMSSDGYYILFSQELEKLNQK
jgi:hypothetical protein